MDGFINFNKDTGIASNKALDRIKRATGQQKAGFLGTLDPIASGVLPVALGWGTKLFPFFEKVPKKYRAQIIFGSETDTQDTSGAVTATAPAGHITREALAAALAKFTGEIDQVPPMFSAKKVGGQRLYHIARKGGQVEREAKKVFVHALELVEFSPDSMVITATVSQGTYIRTLCEDIGRHLGSAAHMGSLVREEVHVFAIRDAWTIERLDERRDHPEEWLLPLDFPIDFLPRFDATAREEKLLAGGQFAGYTGKDAGPIRLYGPGGRFFGIGQADAIGRKIAPEKIMPLMAAIPAKR
jgi:tRNA pseudouridine55 synthase